MHNKTEWSTEMRGISWAKAQLSEMQLSRLSENAADAEKVFEILYETYDQNYYVMRGKKYLEKITWEFYEDGFQDAVAEMYRRFDPEKSNGKNPYNYFADLLERRLLDKLRKEQPAHFVSLRYEDSDGAEGDGLDNLSSQSQNVSAVIGADYGTEDAEERQSKQETMLQLCSVITYLHEVMDQRKVTEADKLRYFRMFYTNESMGILRDGVEHNSVFLEQDELFMRSYDRPLLRFTYKKEPQHTGEFCRLPLRTAGELLPGTPDPEEPPKLPLINKFLQAYWRENYGEEKSEATFSNQSKAWHKFIREQLGIE